MNHTILSKDEANKWDIRFLELAEHIASWSKDPSTQTGAVIVRPDKTICSVGYNGFPKGMDDRDERYQNREEKYDRIVHCEMNAVMNAKESTKGYTLYTWPFLSCNRCAVHMAQAGIIRAVAPRATAKKLERWGDSFRKTCEYFLECGIEIIEVEL